MEEQADRKPVGLSPSSPRWSAKEAGWDNDEHALSTGYTTDEERGAGRKRGTAARSVFPRGAVCKHPGIEGFSPYALDLPDRLQGMPHVVPAHAVVVVEDRRALPPKVAVLEHCCKHGNGRAGDRQTARAWKVAAPTKEGPRQQRRRPLSPCRNRPGAYFTFTVSVTVFALAAL